MTINRLILITMAVIVLVSYLGFDFQVRTARHNELTEAKKQNAVLNDLVDYQAKLLKEAEQSKRKECDKPPFIETSVTLETKMQEWKLLNRNLW